MKRNEATEMPDGLVYLNYKSQNAKELPKAETLPTLINEETFLVLREGDENKEPLLVTEAIDFPIEGSGGVYTKEFFESFLNRLQAHVFGGNKLGHAWPERDDFFTIGGKMNVKPDGKSGTVYLKIYIPSFGFETTNAGFIRNVKAKNVHYSLVTYPVGDLRKDEKDGTVKMHFTGSIGYERNDAVPFEGGAMKQRVNSSEVRGIDIGLARDLIGNGQISLDDKGELFLVNGKVSRPMLRRMVANADCENKTEIAELISMIDRKSNGGKPVELKEAIDMVKNAAANGAVNLAELVKNCGAEKLMRNADDDAKIALANSLTAKLGDKPVETLDAILAENKANAVATVENAVVAAFGAKEVNGKENPAYTYAMKELNGKNGDALKNGIESMKKDPIMVSIRGNMADPNSQVNAIQTNGKATAETDVKTY